MAGDYSIRAVPDLVDLYERLVNFGQEVKDEGKTPAVIIQNSLGATRLLLQTANLDEAEREADRLRAEAEELGFPSWASRHGLPDAFLTLRWSSSGCLATLPVRPR